MLAWFLIKQDKAAQFDDGVHEQHYTSHWMAVIQEVKGNSTNFTQQSVFTGV